MKENNKIQNIIVTALDNVKADHALVYAIVLDCLYRWNNEKYVTDSLSAILSRGHTLSSKKLNGIVLALIEFQQKFEIPKEIILAFMKLIEQRVYEEDTKEGQWIFNFLIILEKQFSVQVFEWLFDLLTDDKRILPKEYRSYFCSIISDLINKNSTNEELTIILKAKKKDLKLIIRESIRISKKTYPQEKLEQVALLKSCTRNSIRKIPVLLYYFLLHYELIFLNLGIALGFISLSSIVLSGIGYYFWNTSGAVYLPSIYVGGYLLFLTLYHLVRLIQNKTDPTLTI